MLLVTLFLNFKIFYNFEAICFLDNGLSCTSRLSCALGRRLTPRRLTEEDGSW